MMEAAVSDGIKYRFRHLTYRLDRYVIGWQPAQINIMHYQAVISNVKQTNYRLKKTGWYTNLL